MGLAMTSLKQINKVIANIPDPEIPVITIKEALNKKQFLFKPRKIKKGNPSRKIKISKNIAKMILDNNTNFSNIRETIYEILTCNLNIHSCLYEINKILFKNISNDKIEIIPQKTLK